MLWSSTGICIYRSSDRVSSYAGVVCSYRRDQKMTRSHIGNEGARSSSIRAGMRLDVRLRSAASYKQEEYQQNAFQCAPTITVTFLLVPSATTVNFIQ